MPDSGGGEAKSPTEQQQQQQQRRDKRRHHTRSGGRRRRRRTTSSAHGVDEDGDGSPHPLFYYSCSSDHHSRHHGGRFSSSSAAAANLAGERCSFGSDRDAIFLPLVGREHPGDGGPCPCSDSPAQGPLSSVFPLQDQCYCHRPSNPSKGAEDLIQKQENQQVVVEEEGSLERRKHSPSKVLRECKNQKNKSEAVGSASGKPQKLRPASIDFNLSPRFFIRGVAGMPKSSAASSQSRSGTFPSPGTPNYRQGAGAGAYHKGWSSERVPLPAHSNRSYGGGGVFLPFNHGRALPSKWEDAEKWILSPISGDGTRRSSVPPAHHRRPKSKSGPIGTPSGITKSYSAASPIIPCFDSGGVSTFTANSPFLAGVLMPEQGYGVNRMGGRGCDTGKGGNVATDGEVMRSYSGNGEPSIARSSSAHGWSDALIESSSSLPSSQDDISEDITEAADVVSPDTKKDAATQMSPEGSTPTSPNQEHSFSRSPQLANCVGQLDNHFSKLEVRDVQVDDQVTMTRWYKKHSERGSSGLSMNIIEWRKRTVEAETSSWGVAETARVISKYKREEAKITAWENLQKAKAEAEIRKLEMKLERKRSSSMDKILNKLRSAQKKAQDMRSEVSARQANQVVKTPKRISYFPKTGQISSLSGCFTCHAC